MKKRLPNVLTISRVFLAAGFIMCILKGTLIYLILATVLFILASITDYYDGYFAKKHNVVSNFGKIMDPIADKILMLTAFYIFVSMEIIPAWMFYVIFVREILVTGLRFWAIKKGTYLAAEKAGKYKTGLQITSVIVILLFLIFKQTPWITSGMEALGRIVVYILMFLAVLLTVFSGISYVLNNRRAFCGCKK